jgi:hypothetical protein
MWLARQETSNHIGKGLCNSELREKHRTRQNMFELQFPIALPPKGVDIVAQSLFEISRSGA